MELVREFVRGQSEAAFAELVRRHLNLVYSVALRFTGQDGEAQDIAQGVFIILARKAAGLRDGTVLTGWLYETTRFTAARGQRANARRRAREQEAYMQSVETDSTVVWQQLAPHLEAAMAQLAERDRTLLALRFYENKTGPETAALLGIREAAAHKRTARALEKLRKFFGKCGVNSTAQIIAGAISANSVHAAPVVLAKSVTAAALAKGAAASTSTLTLVKGALKIMAWTKVKTAIVVGVVLFLVTSTAVVGTRLAQTHSVRQKPLSEADARTKMNDARQFAVGMLMFAHDHQNQLPTNAEQIVSYFKNDPSVQSNLSAFEIVHARSSDTANPSSTIIIREKQPWPTSRRTWARTYAFADGHSEVQVTSSGKFESYERQHGIPPADK